MVISASSGISIPCRWVQIRRRRFSVQASGSTSHDRVDPAAAVAADQCPGHRMGSWSAAAAAFRVATLPMLVAGFGSCGRAGHRVPAVTPPLPWGSQVRTRSSSTNCLPQPLGAAPPFRSAASPCFEGRIYRARRLTAVVVVDRIRDFMFLYYTG